MLPLELLLPGGSPSPTQIIRSCIAKANSWCRVMLLSPVCEAEQVKAAASLFCIGAVWNQRRDVASMNALNGALAEPI